MSTQSQLEGLNQCLGNLLGQDLKFQMEINRSGSTIKWKVTVFESPTEVNAKVETNGTQGN